MNNPRVYQALSVLGFVVSAIFTVKLFASNSTDIISWLAMVATALLYEFGKYILLYQGLKGPFSQGGKTIMLGCWLFVTVASIIASATYVLNDSNANHNVMVENSSAFAQQQNSIQIQNDLYSTTKKEMDDLKLLQIKQQQEGEKIVQNMPSNYTDRKNAQRTATQALIAKTQDQINQKSNNLLNIAAGISAPTHLIIETESTSGGDSFFKLVAQKLNENPQNKNNPYSTKQVGIFFYMAIGVGLEMLANLFAFLSQYYQYGGIIKTSPPPMKKPIPIPEIQQPKEKPTERVIESGRLQGMKFSIKKKDDNIREFKPRIVEKTHRPIELEKPKNSINSVADESDIHKYYSFALENITQDGNAPGRSKMMKGTGFSQEKCRTIHNILKERGTIETADKCTKIVRIGAVI